MQPNSLTSPDHLPTSYVYLMSHGPTDVANYTAEVLSDMADVMDPSRKEPIVLLSCGGAVIGQDLANASGRNVLAYDGLLSVSNIASPATDSSHAHVFRPGRRH